MPSGGAGGPIEGGNQGGHGEVLEREAVDLPRRRGGAEEEAEKFVQESENLRARSQRSFRGFAARLTP